MTNSTNKLDIRYVGVPSQQTQDDILAGTQLNFGTRGTGRIEISSKSERGLDNQIDFDENIQIAIAETKGSRS